MTAHQVNLYFTSLFQSKGLNTPQWSERRAFVPTRRWNQRWNKSENMNCNTRLTLELTPRQLAKFLLILFAPADQ
jgi:hypothetical protein